MNTIPKLRADQVLQPRLPDPCSVKVIGLGGVGGIVARYGAMFLASFDQAVRLVLIDGDQFEASNASRMYFSGHGNKAEVTRADLLDRFKDSQLSLVAVPEFITPENAPRLIHEGDIVLLAVDNHATRKLVNDFCFANLGDVCLISGGNDGIGADSSGRVLRGTYGNVQLYLKRGGVEASPSLARYHPEIAQPADKLPTDLSCTELVKSVPQILFTNLATASAMLNALWLYLCGALHYSELALDVAEGLMHPLAIPAPQLAAG
ncbi:MAG TPA: ThiF family adenylyltransferase [Gemmataceae bacterium]|nr:ThiF family adenylyltransferase [Gemmataceae bacterium]